MNGPQLVRAMLRIRRGPRPAPAHETSPVACPWCAATPGRPCRSVGAQGPLARVHEARRILADLRADDGTHEGGEGR